MLPALGARPQRLEAPLSTLDSRLSPSAIALRNTLSLGHFCLLTRVSAKVGLSAVSGLMSSRLARYLPEDEEFLATAKQRRVLRYRARREDNRPLTALRPTLAETRVNRQKWLRERALRDRKAAKEAEALRKAKQAEAQKKAKAEAQKKAKEAKAKKKAEEPKAKKAKKAM